MRRLRRPLSPRNIGLVYVWIILACIFGAVAPHSFITLATVKIILSGSAVTGLVTVALVLPLSAGLFDLSVGATVGLSGMVAALVAQSGSAGDVVLPLVAAVGVGIGCGVLNGFIVEDFGIDSFIGTLGSSAIFGAITIGVSGDEYVAKNLQGSIGQWLGFGTFGGIALPVYYLLFVMLVLAYLTERTPTGRRLYAIGFNRPVAQLSGLPVRRLALSTLVIAGGLAGFAGVVGVATLGSAAPTFGQAYLLPAFAGAFLGATQFRGGRFNVWGAVVATLVVETANIGILQIGGGTWEPQVFDGGLLLVAIGLTSGSAPAVLRRMRGRRMVHPAPPAIVTSVVEVREQLSQVGEQ